MAQHGSTGQRKPAVGVREVAERAQVAISSVSRVFADHPDVSERMRARVLAAAAELGYEPDILAQSLRRGETLSVGFVVRDISNPILAELALGAETGLTDAGYSTLLTNSHGDPEMDASGIRLFRRRRVDGLLVSLSDEEHEPTRRELAALGVPFVLTDRELLGMEPMSAVLSDYEASLGPALARLIELGHRTIGLIAGARRIYPMRALHEIAQRACAEAGAELVVERGELDPDDAAAETHRMLDRARRPTAIVSGSNQILVGVLHAVRERGLTIPDEVSLIGIDDVPLLDLFEPPIAVISRDPRELGRQAAELLVEQIRGGEPRVVALPTSFDPRASIAAPPRAG